MPKISDDKRAARRAQILDAAWTCFQRNGIHATTMDDIVRASGLSAGAVYSHFAGKEDLILAAVTTSLTGIAGRAAALLDERPAPPPDLFLRRAADLVADFTTREGYDLRRIALLGWSEAQRSEQLRDVMQDFYLPLREMLAEVAGDWVAAGLLRPGAVPQYVARLMLSAILGHVVQSVILGDVAPDDLARGLRDLTAGGGGE
jgi:AcrR family transcriptional regulator